MSFKSFISGMEPAPFPTPSFDFYSTLILKVLDPGVGSVYRADALLNAFTWDDTPQGFDYWNDAHCRLSQGEELSDEAQEYLRSLIE